MRKGTMDYIHALHTHTHTHFYFISLLMVFAHFLEIKHNRLHTYYSYVNK